MEQQEREKYVMVKKRIWLASIPAILLLVVIWLTFLVSQTLLSQHDTMRLGILPGNITGLWGILFSPLLHSSFSHLWSNSLSLLILTWFLFYFYSKIALKAFAALWIISGAVTWLIGRDALHVGASGLVFAMLFFLFFSGIFRKYIPLIAVSLIVAFIYGGSVWSIFPVTELRHGGQMAATALVSVDPQAERNATALWRKTSAGRYLQAGQNEGKKV